MCGIIGFSCDKDFQEQHIRSLIKQLFVLSESRGKEASGIAIGTGQDIRFIRSPFTASELVKSRVFTDEVDTALGKTDPFLSLIGHSRLVTNGYEHNNTNNQPVIVGSVMAVHNGIIVNYREAWAAHSQLQPHTELDSEVIPALLSHYAQKNLPVSSWMPMLYAQLKGTASTAVLLADRPLMLLATNNGSLYYARHSEGKAWVFGSERYILETALQKNPNTGFLPSGVKQLQAGHFIIIDLQNQHGVIGQLTSGIQHNISSDVFPAPLPIIEVTTPVSTRPVELNRSMEYACATIPKELVFDVEKRRDRIEALKRCTHCILPETFPFISFDVNGICNYCHFHIPSVRKGVEALAAVADLYRGKISNGYDCLVPFSGGRDSSYALHYIKEELKLNPLAFSYDWGMLTDIGRRNQARMCGALGVEHILVSADIRKKRKNIRLNVLAWLKKPNLGTIPLFMAGDKKFLHIIGQLLKRNSLELSFVGENMLETTRFKTGFCGIPPHFSNENTYTLPLIAKMRMAVFYGHQYLLNPAFINTSLLDTLDAFSSYYVRKHENLNIFDYLSWDEQTIESTLIHKYDWETDPSTSTTWRIGDGTAAFYNYIYYMVAGFTENDTFRSNQIREGMISRDEALRKANTENLPRWDSIQWYCNVIQIDWERAIGVINRIKPLYE